MNKRKGIIKIYLSEALHIQLPPDNSIDALRTKVKAKNKAEQIPIKIGCKNVTSYGNRKPVLCFLVEGSEDPPFVFRKFCRI
ncbi:hypothetical protein [Bacillus sp. T3]|uniref:hypothetical protein n=1 Tax=Bacillus sp. T3 TaxID=467262 RepID=UPI002981BDFC|nr:hypothetical protein [Bacillus sp. T3]